MNRVINAIVAYISQLFEPSEEKVDEILGDVFSMSPSLKLEMLLSTLDEETLGDNGLGADLPPRVHIQSNPVFRACVERVLESILFFSSAYPLSVRELFHFFETASFRTYVPSSEYEVWAGYLLNKTLAGSDVRGRVVVLEQMLLKGNSIDWRLSSHTLELILLQDPHAENWARIVSDHRNSVRSNSAPTQTANRNQVRTYMQQWKKETVQIFEDQNVL